MTDSKTLIVLKELFGNSPPALTAVQQFVVAHSDVFEFFWWSLWIAAGATALMHLFKELRAQRNN